MRTTFYILVIVVIALGWQTLAAQPVCIRPDNLVAEGDSGVGAVVVTWDTPGSYNAIEVYRNGVLAATLPGDTTSFVDTNLPPGIYGYTLSAICALGVVVDSDHTATFLHAPFAPVTNDFTRADCNVDGAVDISDAIQVLGYLFIGAAITCEVACDSNNDGAIDIGDAVFTLLFLFQAGSMPPEPPFPGCGLDPTPDSLGCDQTSVVCAVPAPLDCNVDPIVGNVQGERVLNPNLPPLTDDAHPEDLLVLRNELLVRGADFTDYVSYDFSITSPEPFSGIAYDPNQNPIILFQDQPIVAYIETGPGAPFAYCIWFQPIDIGNFSCLTLVVSGGEVTQESFTDILSVFSEGAVFANGDVCLAAGNWKCDMCKGVVSAVLGVGSFIAALGCAAVGVAGGAGGILWGCIVAAVEAFDLTLGPQAICKLLEYCVNP